MRVEGGSNSRTVGVLCFGWCTRSRGKRERSTTSPHLALSQMVNLRAPLGLGDQARGTLFGR